MCYKTVTWYFLIIVLYVALQVCIKEHRAGVPIILRYIYMHPCRSSLIGSGADRNGCVDGPLNVSRNIRFWVNMDCILYTDNNKNAHGVSSVVFIRHSRIYTSYIVRGRGSRFRLGFRGVINSPRSRRKARTISKARLERVEKPFFTA